MNKYEDIISIKDIKIKNEKLIDYYKNEVKINDWLNISAKNIIVKFKDRTEYKKNNLYHRINGPAIDYNNEKLDKYYYKGELLEKEDWQKITIKEIRKIKIKKLNQQNVE